MSSLAVLDDELDILGQAPGLYKLYTQICLCYASPSNVSPSSILQTLRNGLERLSEQIPWVAGQVVNVHAGSSRPAVFKIKPLDKIPRFIMKDLRATASMPTMDGLTAAGFPFSILGERTICPRNTLSQTGPNPAEILLVQANLISGGLLLVIQAQHNILDMTGQFNIARLFSKACHDDTLADDEVALGNPDRANTIRLLKEADEVAAESDPHTLDAPALKIPEGTPEHTAAAQLPTCSWAYFLLSQESLASLKASAMESLSSGFVSTDDVLSAFIWESLTTFARAVDVRRHLDIHPAYPGVVNTLTYTHSTIRDVLAQPLGIIAAQLRRAVDPSTSDIGIKTRALATALSRATDKSAVPVIASMDLTRDIMLSSWAKYDFYDLDFGLGLGKPVSVRRPRFAPVESLCYLMPKAPDGEIAVAMCLRDEDMARLREDGEFTRIAKYVG